MCLRVSPSEKLSLTMKDLVVSLMMCTIFAHADGTDPTDPITPFMNGVKQVQKEYEAPDTWNRNAQMALAKKLKERPLVKQAKNIILFLGDSWSVTTLTASRILKGQQVDKVPFGEEGQLHVDTFPYTGTSKTYCVNAQVADSACSGTAYLCGVKSNIRTIGVASNVKLSDCDAQKNPQNHVTSILQWAQEAGKSTGVVTNTRITDASPSATYAHVANRQWECDDDGTKFGMNPEKCDDIAEQLILSEPGNKIDVILGGGRKKFLPENIRDVEGAFGQRKDGKNLIEQWKAQNTGNTSHPRNATFVQTAQELRNVNPATTERLFGLFANDDLAYYHDQEKKNHPTLTDMTEKAIQILSKNPKGFFLFVEGGLIDNAHHSNLALRSIWEAVEFDRAIKKGDDMTSDDNTLITVTADHSNTLTFAGYGKRGGPLTDFGGMGDDGLPYSILSYPVGPGFRSFVNNTRHNLTKDDKENLDYRAVPLVPLKVEYLVPHSGEDVMIFSKGPFAHLLTGVHEENEIPHMMAYAACVGSGMTYCNTDSNQEA